jgi:flavorubredoxin
MQNITENIKYIGVSAPEPGIFEGQYPIPEGITYNSYLILGEKTAVLDTADADYAEIYLANLEAALGERQLDYLVVSHVEPDHTGSMQALLDKYPQVCVVGNAKTFTLLQNYVSIPESAQTVTVNEGDVLELGGSSLKFITAPMIHWPEVMMSYEQTEGILFSADAFGRFGTENSLDEWTNEARRYYFNIVGKYGNMVQSVLKKLAPLDIRKICPLHGPILSAPLDFYLEKYSTWSSYTPESDGVFIAYVSFHGNTEKAALKLGEILRARGVEVSCCDLAYGDNSYAVDGAFRFGKLVLCAPTQDAGTAPVMEDLLYRLKSKNFQNRTVGIIENGSWAPFAGKIISTAMEGMKNITVIDPAVTVRGGFKEDYVPALEALADALTQ